MNKAIFLDRDGVLNPNVHNFETGKYESPHHPEDFALYTFVEKSLQALKSAGYIIVLVSNQPSYAKGKASMDSLKQIAELLKDWSDEHGGLIDKFCYCFHHPEGVVPEYTKVCECRKPGTLFLEQAKEQFNLDPTLCWFIGDRDTDIICGYRFGCKTVKVSTIYTLYDVVKMILEKR